MSRVAKYKAWHKQERKMYEVSVIHFGVQYGMAPSDSANLVLLCDKSEYYREGEEVELLECTPVTDSKGKEIYEADFVNWVTGESLDGMYKVVWIEYGWFLVRESDGHKEPLYANLADGKGSTLEVVCSSYGWHENPELIHSSPLPELLPEFREEQKHGQS
jgi:hypothetical protein